MLPRDKVENWKINFQETILCFWSTSCIRICNDSSNISDERFLVCSNWLMKYKTLSNNLNKWCKRLNHGSGHICMLDRESLAEAYASYIFYVHFGVQERRGSETCNYEHWACAFCEWPNTLILNCSLQNIQDVIRTNMCWRLPWSEWDAYSLDYTLQSLNENLGGCKLFAAVISLINLFNSNTILSYFFATIIMWIQSYDSLRAILFTELYIKVDQISQINF